VVANQVISGHYVFRLGRLIFSMSISMKSDTGSLEHVIVMWHDLVLFSKDVNLLNSGVVLFVRGYFFLRGCGLTWVQKHGSHVDPLDEDYIVIHVFRK
jgi:hypothetical protein